MSISTVEKLTEKRNAACTLKMLKVNEGVNLFVEDASLAYPGIEQFDFLEGDAAALSKWETEFELEKNRFTVKFNDPLEEGEKRTEIQYPHLICLD